MLLFEKNDKIEKLFTRLVKGKRAVCVNIRNEKEYDL